ncbi:MAG: LPS export ABC transporter ATP-binding protein [Pseudomonadales bacterium]|nr:LPS export ABC transporter ATP-binding protein [Pseudomonadales bacterium]
MTDHNADSKTKKEQKLRAIKLQKKYGSHLAVADISLEIKTGEIIGLLGANGAGKTTSFYMIVGILKPDSGTILLDDTNITGKAMHERAKLGLGYLPQEASVFRRLSVEDNLKAILELRSDMNKQQRQDLLEQLLEEFHLTQVRHQLGERLSGGERRRVEIARCLTSTPSFIMLDEPFAGVDPISVNDIKRMIKDLAARNIGILITDHNVRETLDICDRAYIVNEGCIIAEGDTESILANTRVRDVYLGENFRL